MDVAKENQQDECVEMLFKIAQPVFTVRNDNLYVIVFMLSISCHPHLMKKTLTKHSVKMT